MRSALGYLWAHNRPALIAFVVVAIVTVGFGVRLVLFGMYWSDPAHQDQTPQGWMTPRYIARSWDVPPEVVTDALDLQMPPARRMTLEEIATDRSMPMPVLADQIMDAMDTYRAETPRR